MIGNALKLIRQYHHLNQVELATKLFVSTSYLSKLESGKAEPTLEILQRYSTVFNVPLSSLVVFSETLEGQHQQSKAKAYISRKMLKILAWIADGNEKKHKPVEKLSN